MKNAITVDFCEKSIRCTASALDRASKMIEPEFSTLRGLVKDFPDYQIVVQSSHRITANSNRGLTFAAMREYIETIPDNEIFLEEFAQVLEVLDRMPGKYALVKQWFLTRFPEFRTPVCSLQVA